MKLRPLFALAVFVCLAAVPLASAADQRPVDLPLKNGKVLTGIVESSTAEEVVLRTGPDQERRIPWQQLAPLGLYRAQAALAPAADGKARMKLAELAVDLGLHVHAREEYEKALALGAITQREFDHIVRRAEHDAVEAGIRYAEKAADDGDLEAALEVARQLKLHFAGAPNASKIGRLIAGLLEKVHELDAEAVAAQKELERIKVEVRRNKEILTRKTKALDLFNTGRKTAAESKQKQAQGSVTRARKLAESADKQFREARRHLGRLRRILGREHPERADVLVQLNRLDSEQFDLLFGMAWFLVMQAGSYSQGERFAARASYIDPVHPDLVELREHILESRIRYRVSDVTNATGRVTGPFGK